MIDYRIMPELKLIAFCNWGVTPVEEILTLSQKLRTDPKYSKDYDAILDNTYLERHYTSEEIHRLSERRFETRLSPVKVAIIAPKDISYGMSRMHQIITDGKSPIQISVFRDTRSALTWLDREGLDVESLFKEIRGEEI